MAEIDLIRIDFRLIHGQVVTKWVRQTKADRIVIIDDNLSKDDFMADIYRMAAPVGYSVEVYSVDDAVRIWQENQMGKGSLFILFASVEQAYKAFKEGLPIKELQIGGLGSAPGRKVVFGPITLDKKDADMLEDMQDSGAYIYLHQVPDEPKMDFAAVLKKFNF